MVSKKILIVGAGISGITLAERSSANGNTVTIIDKRNHIGGNCYDIFDNTIGCYISQYGAHIFHTDNKEVWNYLSQFTEWENYQHKVLAFVDGQYIPLPFNLNSLRQVIPNELANTLENKLIDKVGFGNKISILELKNSNDLDIKGIGEYIFKKIFLHYTEKQWGTIPEDIDKDVLRRVPVYISKDNRYFQDEYQGIPRDGYSFMFRKMLNNRNISVRLNTDFINFKNKTDFDQIYYTGPIDEYFNYKYGRLSYRCFNMKFKTYPRPYYQQTAVVNYPNNYNFTRITEFKHFYPNNKFSNNTIIGEEYPDEMGVQAWPIINPKNLQILDKYLIEAETLPNIKFVGRLAEFKYYDMDDAIANVLKLNI